MSNDFKKIILNPSNIYDIVGFDFLFPKSSIVNKMLENNKIYSILFFGPPGCGKSLSIRLLLDKLSKKYYVFNASIDNKELLIKYLSNATQENKVILLIEEIHRLNKDKQDILLSFLETETIYLFATTTENPYFVVNPAIRSRMYIYEMKKINDYELIPLVKKYLKDKEIKIDDYIIELIVYNSNCDFRQIFSYIDIAINLYKNNTEEIINNMFGNYNSKIDCEKTIFYDILSAYHKSIRGSDPDAAIYYLGMLLQNNNLLPIFRRLYAIAYEDIGLANPTASSHTHSAIEAAKALGMPEARIPLSAITIELALSPKSATAINAIDDAIDVIKKQNYLPPHHIRDNHYSSAIKLGVVGYKYPHNYVNDWVEQQYLPNELKNKQFYKYNKYSNFEIKHQEYWNKIKGNK